MCCYVGSCFNFHGLRQGCGCVESLRQRIADLRAERPEVTETMELLKEGVKQ
jgi:hypothetical protein